jgi:hypothetical protein
MSSEDEFISHLMAHEAASRGYLAAGLEKRRRWQGAHIINWNFL